ncbi:hypothetical protein OHA21_07865 [Actinoplanes sp. NBC_00393]|uniref:hypothetical protein n=1 Tax=Actinoplanes sp. NBC_00393 TaxID=2975953 RepID=UPI002E1D7C2A
MGKTIGTLLVAVLLTFAVYMAIFRGWGAHPPEPTTSTVASLPSASQPPLVAAALPGVTASTIREAWRQRWEVPIKETSRQVTLSPAYPNGKGNLRLTMTRVPEDAEAVWGVSCARSGKPAPYSRADLTELLDFCLPPEVAGERRAEIVAWLAPLDDSTWRVHRQFTGFTAVVKHSQPKDKAPPSLQLALTGGTYFPA